MGDALALDRQTAFVDALAVVAVHKSEQQFGCVDSEADSTLVDAVELAVTSDTVVTDWVRRAVGRWRGEVAFGRAWVGDEV